MADSNIQKLYEFLKEYDLIQTDLSEEEIQEYINSIYSSLEKEESLLTGFISNSNINNSQKPRAFFVTNNNRVLFFPGENNQSESFNIDDIDYIDDSEENSLLLKIKNYEDEISIIANDVEGIDTINDALYSSFAETLDEESLIKIFGEDEDEVLKIEEKDKEENQYSQEIIETSTSEETIENQENLADTAIIINEIENDEIPENSDNQELIEENSLVPANSEIIPVEETEVVSFTTQTDDSGFLKKANGKEKIPEVKAEETKKQGFHLTKPMIYVLAGIGILALILVGYLIYDHFAKERANQELAGELIDYFNQADEIYFTMKDYQTANFAGIPVENLDSLDTQAQDIENKLLDIEPTEGTDELYQNIFFYDDALISAAYYGKVFINTQNQLNRLSFDSMLDAAYRYRLTILGLIRDNYPDLTGNIQREPDMDLDAEFAQQEENSMSSEGALNRENSKSSNESLENSTSSREEYLNSKASQN